MFFARPISNFYSRFERPISSFSLLAGFIFDILTLKRADAFFENLWIFGYLVIIGVFIILVHGREQKEGSRAHFWYANILQFAFGGVFSAFLILYFRSADIFSAWPFIALLAGIFIANEFLKKHYVRLSFQISLFFLAIFCFLIFSVPVVLHQIGISIFLLSGLLSLITITLFAKILFYFSKDKSTKSKKLIAFLVFIVFSSINFLYFTNLIPPIPLSLKDGGIYHDIRKNSEGNYEVVYDDRGWGEYFKLYKDVAYRTGEPVYAYSAVFSPKNFKLTISHEWQRYDDAKNKWITDRVIYLPVKGGRDGGFRTYSLRTNLSLGRWRVNVKTEQNQIIGRLLFDLIPPDSKTILKTTIK